MSGRKGLRPESSASVGLLEEGEHIGGELFVMLEEEAVRRIGIDLTRAFGKSPARRYE
jgi:hypothetical protein